MLGNLGLGEILIILVLILVLFGPQKIPELAGTVGRYINQFRRQMEEAQRAVIDPLRADLNMPPSNGGYPYTGNGLGGGSSGGAPLADGALGDRTLGAPPTHYDAPVPLTDEEERARQPKRLLD